MIISASRRTDIPACYSDWFLKRVQEGFLFVRNPKFRHSVSRISLSPSVVDCIVFWTKNPLPMLDKLPAIRDYMYYFQFTVTGYGKDIEPHIPNKKNVILPAFIRLSEQLGKDRMVWRYDPILFNDRYTPEYHLRAFGEIARTLEGYTDTCVISFLDNYSVYGQAVTGLQAEDKTDDFLLDFSSKLAVTAKEHGMTVSTCAEEIDLSPVGIGHNACIDKTRIERLLGTTLSPLGKDTAQRSECLCSTSIDIGTYNTCPNGCRYCYANLKGDAMVKLISARYDINSPMLCDRVREEDEVVENKNARSLVRRETDLFGGAME
ncbi:MAG: DUF1848 domain-containing protein [Acidaminococcaceae bacterium]|nr:DUF1848 domain-containing protein [Acidaminococcaceae bacterium]